LFQRVGVKYAVIECKAMNAVVEKGGTKEPELATSCRFATNDK